MVDLEKEEILTPRDNDEDIEIDIASESEVEEGGVEEEAKVNTPKD